MPKDAKSFIEEVSRNAELRHEMFNQSSKVVLDLAKQHGFQFSKQELHDALHEKLGVVPEGIRDSESDASNCVVVIVAAAGRQR